MRVKDIAVAVGALTVDYVIGQEIASKAHGLLPLYHIIVLMTYLVIATLDSSVSPVIVLLPFAKMYNLVMLGVASQGGNLSFLFGFFVCLSLVVLAGKERIRLLGKMFSLYFSMPGVITQEQRKPLSRRNKEEEDVASLM